MNRKHILLLIILFGFFLNILKSKGVFAAEVQCIIKTDPIFLTTKTPVYDISIYCDQLAEGQSYMVAPSDTHSGSASKFKVGRDQEGQKYMKIHVSTGNPAMITDIIANEEKKDLWNSWKAYLGKDQTLKIQVIKSGGWANTVFCTGTITINKPLLCSDLKITNNANFKIGETVKFEGNINQKTSFYMRVFDGNKDKRDGVTINNFTENGGLYKFSNYEYKITEGKPGTWTLKGVYHGLLGFDGEEIPNCTINFGVESSIIQPSPPDTDCPNRCYTDRSMCSSDTECKEKCDYCANVNIPPSLSNITELCNDKNIKSVEQQNDCIQCFKKQEEGGKGGVWTALGCIQTDISGFVSSFFKIGLGIGGGIAFLFLIYGGFLVMTSAGNPETIQQGKDIITSAISGLLLIIFSVLLLQLISVDILKIPGFEKTSTTSSPSSTSPSSTDCQSNGGTCKNQCVSGETLNRSLTCPTGLSLYCCTCSTPLCGGECCNAGETCYRETTGVSICVAPTPIQIPMITK